MFPVTSTPMASQQTYIDSNKENFINGLNKWKNDPTIEGIKEEAFIRILYAYENDHDTLDLSSLYLTSLPEQIGKLTNLTVLYLEGNNLTSLPEQIGTLTNLTTLYISHNPNLLNLPLSLQNLTQITHIIIYETGISDDTRNAILRACQANRSEYESERKLPTSLNLWSGYAQFKKNDLDFILKFSKEEKGSLYEWLLRLTKTSDFSGRQEELAKTVCNMLKSLETNQDFKISFFAQVASNLSDCQDRAAIALNEIYSAWKLHILPKGASIQESLATLKGIASTNTLRKRIANLIDRKQKKDKITLKESTEIYLFFETRLRETLGLETAVTSMSYEQMGRCSWIKDEELIKYVKENYQQELIDLPAFEDLANNNKEYLDDLSKVTSQYDQMSENLEKQLASNKINEMNYKSEFEELSMNRENAITATKIKWLQNKISLKSIPQTKA